MSTSTVLVRNISKSLKQEDMADLFGCIGRIAHMDWVEEETENFCKVTFETTDCVKAAMHLNGTPLGDRNLSISATSFASPSALPAKRLPTPAETIASLREAARKLNPQEAGDELALSEDAALIAKTVYIGNISPMADELSVRAAFADCGNIIYSKMAGNPAVGVKFCFMEFDSPLAAQRAIAKPPASLVIGDRAVKVGPATNPIVKPAEVAVNNDPVRIESAMKRVLRAKRSIEARKSRLTDGAKEAGKDGAKKNGGKKDGSKKDGAKKEGGDGTDGSRRHKSRRKSRRSDGRRSRSRSRSRSRRRSRRSVSREEDGEMEIVKPRKPLSGRRVGNPTQSQNGLVWDGFTWVTPTGLSVRQKSENLATKIMDVVSGDAASLNPTSQQALVQQAHQQAALLQAHMSKLRKQ